MSSYKAFLKKNLYLDAGYRLECASRTQDITRRRDIDILRPGRTFRLISALKAVLTPQNTVRAKGGNAFLGSCVGA